MDEKMRERRIVERRVGIDGGGWVSREGDSITISYDYAGRATREDDHFYARDIRELAQFVEDTDAALRQAQSTDVGGEG